MPDPSSRILRVVRLVGAPCLLAVVGGCGTTANSGTTMASPISANIPAEASEDSSNGTDPCLTLCQPWLPATLRLACPSVVTSEQLTGPCTGGCRRTAKRADAPCYEVEVVPTQPGLCRIDLTFEGGFTYSADVTFVQSTSGTLCPCTSLGPTQGNFTVDNPSTTCVDAGPDAEADAGLDAGDG